MTEKYSNQITFKFYLKYKLFCNKESEKIEFPEFPWIIDIFKINSLIFPDFPWNFSKSQHFRGFPGFPGSVWTLRDKTIPQLLEKPSCLSEVITENIQNIILVLIFQMIKIYPWLHIHDFELSLDGVSGQRWREKKRTQ